MIPVTFEIYLFQPRKGGVFITIQSESLIGKCLLLLLLFLEEKEDWGLVLYSVEIQEFYSHDLRATTNYEISLAKNSVKLKNEMIMKYYNLRTVLSLAKDFVNLQ